MARQLRWPPDVAEFNGRRLPAVQILLPERWWNLRWEAHLTPATMFHASKTGRLTPEDGTVKSLYLAAQETTSFYEIYGDDIALAKESGTSPVLSKQEMVDRVFATTPAGLAFKVYDLTTEGSAKGIGMDLATLYTGEVERPRRFAQRLHDHPEKFDGVRYISRHTGALRCVVANLYPTLANMVLRATPLWDHATYATTTPRDWFASSTMSVWPRHSGTGLERVACSRVSTERRVVFRRDFGGLVFASNRTTSALRGANDSGSCARDSAFAAGLGLPLAKRIPAVSPDGTPLKSQIWNLKSSEAWS